MAPTYAVGQPLLVDTRAYFVKGPAVGDIVVLYPPQGAVDPNGSRCGTKLVAPDALCPLPTSQRAAVKFVKRIVAGPGDQIALINGHVVLNGRLQADRFIQPCAGGEQCTFPRPITVPGGYWFVLGDNRGQSDDSRFWGPIKTAWIVGKVVG